MSGVASAVLWRRERSGYKARGQEEEEEEGQLVFELSLLE
jgi:hypothetical protein